MGAERRARTTAIATMATAQNGTSGVLAYFKHARRRMAWPAPRTGVGQSGIEGPLWGGHCQERSEEAPMRRRRPVSVGDLPDGPKSNIWWGSDGTQLTRGESQAQKVNSHAIDRKFPHRCWCNQQGGRLRSSPAALVPSHDSPVPIGRRPTWMSRAPTVGRSGAGPRRSPAPPPLPPPGR